MTRKFFFFSEMGYNAYPLEALEQYGYSALLFHNSILPPGHRPNVNFSSAVSAAPRAIARALDDCGMAGPMADKRCSRERPHSTAVARSST